jgi:hypothetical protein
MQHELLFKAITQATIGVIFLTLLLVLLFMLRKEIQGGKRLSGIVIFALAMMSLWSFLAFAEVYVSFRKMFVSQSISEHLAGSQTE